MGQRNEPMGQRNFQKRSAILNLSKQACEGRHTSVSTSFAESWGVFVWYDSVYSLPSLPELLQMWPT